MSPETNNTDSTSTPAPVETEARALGWVPAEEFKGNPDRWVDAESFVERGKAIMPILRKNNEKLLGDVTDLRGKVNQLEQALSASTEAIEALKGFHNENVKEQVAAARKELLMQLKQAREDGNVEGEVDIQDQLANLRSAEEDVETRPAKSATVKDYTKEPWMREWTSQNPWFGTDRRKTALANGIAEELRQSGSTLTGKAFLDEVSKEVESTLAPRSNAGKVEGSGGGHGANFGGGRSYADLPADAKTACDRQAERLVGPNGAFKNVSDWRKYYVDLYFKG